MPVRGRCVDTPRPPFGLPIYAGSRAERGRRDPELVAGRPGAAIAAVRPIAFGKRRGCWRELAALGVQDEVAACMAPCRP